MYARTLLQGVKYILSCIFPQRDDERVASGITPERFITYAQPNTTRGVTSLLPYDDPEVRAVLWEAKFHMNDHATSLLAAALASYLDKKSLRDCILIPIPLSSTRLRERGYNQCERIADEAVRILPGIERTSLLKKIRETAPQTTQKRNARLQNLTHAFLAHIPDDMREKHLVVIDDVYTTGATLTEARRALRDAGATHITCIALCRAR